MTVATGIADISLVVPVILDVVGEVLTLFMEPPLIFFTGAAFIFVGFKVAAYLLKSARNMA